MIIDYVSDIHIDHYVRFQENQNKWERNTRMFSRKLFIDGNRDALIVAGDIGEWNRQSFWFLDEATKFYNIVFVVFGNHDYYLFSKEQSKKYNNNSLNKVQELKELFSKNKKINLLNKDVVVYNGKTFSGDVMWYFPNSIQDQSFFMNQMPDSEYIKSQGIEPLELMLNLHSDSINWYKLLEVEQQKIDVFISHVPPINNPKSPFPYNECFVTPVPFLIAKHWVAGHQHTQYDFKILDTNVYMNPIGYPGENNTFGLKSFEI